MAAFTVLPGLLPLGINKPRDIRWDQSKDKKDGHGLD
jgi:hypothetical protein